MHRFIQVPVFTVSIFVLSSCIFPTSGRSSRVAHAQEPDAPISESIVPEPESYPLEIEAIRCAYPDFFLDYKNDTLFLTNGEAILFDDLGEEADKLDEEALFLKRLDACSVKDMFYDVYPLGALTEPAKGFDPGRYRQDALFKAMYGHTEKEVASNLEKVDVFGSTVKFSSVNGAADNLRKVLEDIEMNHPDLKKYFIDPSSFYWRAVRGADRMSAHSYGIAIDIGVKYSDYWRWSNKNATELDTITYHNRFPEELILVFEQYGFISGARWYHYDTMHFEYRPELIAYARMKTSSVKNPGL